MSTAPSWSPPRRRAPGDEGCGEGEPSCQRDRLTLRGPIPVDSSIPHDNADATTNAVPSLARGRFPNDRASAAPIAASRDATSGRGSAYASVLCVIWELNPPGAPCTPDRLSDRSILTRSTWPPPQEVAMADVRKEINFCRKTGLKVIGVVENMSSLMVRSISGAPRQLVARQPAS